MKDILYDQYRITGKLSSHISIYLLLTNRGFRRIYYFRKIQNSKGLKQYFFKMLCHILLRRVSIEIPNSVRIGKGILINHPYGITFNSKSIIGDNFTILKGATIGNSKTGKVGTPVIGNNVYVGLNSTVVGGITIGNNVLIAANTFVNFDVPDNSIVIGSPGVIHHKENASMPYITNMVKE